MLVVGSVCVRVSLLGSKAHAETGQVPIGEGEEDHEDDVPGVVVKWHREVVTRLDITQHEQRDEDDPQTHQDREPDTVFTRLQRDKHRTISHRQELQVMLTLHCNWGCFSTDTVNTFM